MKCPAFESLINDMNVHNIDKEHYTFHYNGFQFDVILSITHNGYELLVAVHTHNWGCVLTMNRNYNIEVPNEVYYSLCNLLHLNWNIHHFGSATFLRLLSEKAPDKSSCRGVNYEMLIDYLPYRHVDEKDKIYYPFFFLLLSFSFSISTSAKKSQGRSSIWTIFIRFLLKG